MTASRIAMGAALGQRDHTQNAQRSPTRAQISAGTSSWEPSECSAIPIAKYAIDRAGIDRRRCSVRPHYAKTAKEYCVSTYGRGRAGDLGYPAGSVDSSVPGCG